MTNLQLVFDYGKINSSCRDICNKWTVSRKGKGKKNITKRENGS